MTQTAGLEQETIAAQPGIFIKIDAVRKVLQASPANGERFRASVCALIAIGNVIAIGENQIERTFAHAHDFDHWFEGMDLDQRVADAVAADDE